MLIALAHAVLPTLPPAPFFLWRRAGFFCLLLLCSSAVLAAPAKKKRAVNGGAQITQPQSKAARERMKNRAKLMAAARKRPAVVPLTPEQKKREAAARMAQRAYNREQMAMHTRWRPGQLGGSERLWPLATEELMAEMSSPRVEATLRKVIDRLKLQLGKPYVWGGESPERGFDCSGLIYYAYNQLLNRKLPRTANAMYQDRQLQRVRPDRLRRGDLVFFSIKTPNKADHVGVYLGQGQFIEAPRTGLNIRISQLASDYWQQHFLGAKRVLTEEAIL